MYKYKISTKNRIFILFQIGTHLKFENLKKVINTYHKKYIWTLFNEIFYIIILLSYPITIYNFGDIKTKYNEFLVFEFILLIFITAHLNNNNPFQKKK